VCLVFVYVVPEKKFWSRGIELGTEYRVKGKEGKESGEIAMFTVLLLQICHALMLKTQPSPLSIFFLGWSPLYILTVP